MSKPTMVAIEIELLTELLESLRGYIEAEYQYRDKYPIQKRRFDRDIEPVVKAENLLRFA